MVLLRNFEKAAAYLDLANDIQRKTFDANDAVSLNRADFLESRMGLLDEKLGKYQDALGHFQASLKYIEQYKSKFTKNHQSDRHTDIGRIELLMGNDANAIRSCKEGYGIALQQEYFLGQQTSCNCLYTIYKAQGEKAKAFDYLEKLGFINERINVEETKKQLQNAAFAIQMQTDSLAKAEEFRLVTETYEEEVQQEEKTRNIGFGIGGLVLLLAGSLYSRLRYVRKAKANLQIEKYRSEDLLLNILPAHIAAELKEKGKAEARDFERASILFSDFKGFTLASAKLSAQELVAEINICFEASDGIMETHGIEKIKTVGDAYMSAGGLPVPTEASVKNTVHAALEMQAFIGKRKAEMDACGHPAFEMRVGIHTGPVVAGIVGVKKFQYDIWGDTVNTASRIENAGAVGKVNISQATYNLLKDDPEFAFESRGKIEAKGKGEIEMWFVSATSL